MCGIAGFISNEEWKLKRSDAWLEELTTELQKYSTEEQPPWDRIGISLRKLISAFDSMMSFSFHYSLVSGSGSLKLAETAVDLLSRYLDKLITQIAEKGQSDEYEQLMEDMRDCLWQLRQEVIGNIRRTLDIMPEEYRSPDVGIEPHFAAWAIEQVMENLDRLEVRGRDSAGISIQLLLNSTASAKHLKNIPDFADRLDGEVKVNIWNSVLDDGRRCVTFIYKISNLVGRLGDNTAGLRSAILNDVLLWNATAELDHISIISHTRWASNGIISLGNCHPVDGKLYGDDHGASIEESGAVFVLNGDVDNYKTLVDKYVSEQGFQIDPSVTTDAKILPIVYRLGADLNLPVQDRFGTVMKLCDGSLAVVMQNPKRPRKLFLSQKGSGQSLFIGKLADGYILASEVYGLAARTRQSYSLSGTERGGTVVVINANASTDALSGSHLDDGHSFSLKAEPIYIHSRDIYRGDYDYYFEKEIFEAPDSVRKTIKGKYRKITGKIEFAKNGIETFSRLLSRIRDKSRPPIRRIMVIGQGTASIAAMGTAWLIQRSLAGTKIVVNWSKSSELSGFLVDEPLDDMLLVAISQSGTTTDTNRTVDVVGSQGAWIHSIVNRRNSPLVSKSNSHFYTSDGRDVEMAVASTKAFYSQIASGKLLSLLVAQEFRSLTEDEIYQEISELEKLPQQIGWVLNHSEQIKDCAEEYGPRSRNWAVVGNGPNKIAADEIRIKLSELCYKSIPCDFTEDKKHIDLSTEPLTLVVANDLPEQIVQDTAKEVAIFKAHNGKPIVLVTRGEKRFNEYAERLIELPPIGAGLGFVLATVAGHLWGFYTAKAIDSRAEEFRNIRTYLTGILEQPDSWSPEIIQSRVISALRFVAGGEMNSSLPASTAAYLALFVSDLPLKGLNSSNIIEIVANGITILNKAIEEMTRPIDTIRHQAKTVTVGITRPQEILSPILLDALERLAIAATKIKEQDRRVLRLVSPIISSIAGGMFYEIAAAPGDGLRIRAVKKTGFCEGKHSRYDEFQPIGGSKRTALRLERAIWSAGPVGDENLLIIPLFDEFSGAAAGIALLHLNFQTMVSTQQKLNILRGLGARYYEVLERLEEVAPGTQIEDALDTISPRDLILAPADRIIEQQ